MNEPPRRRWWQFSLRSLLLAMVVVASFLAGRASLQRELQKARQEAEAGRAVMLRAMEAERQMAYVTAMAQAQANLAQRNATLQKMLEIYKQAEEADPAPPAEETSGSDGVSPP